jgi:hypothetical protein
MALIKSITLINNFEEESFFKNAYLRVTRVNSTKSEATIELCYCKNNESSPLIIRYFPFAIDLDGPNPIKQAYEHLKTLPEFEGAEDC